MNEYNYDFFDKCTSLNDAAKKIFNDDNYRKCEKIKILTNNVEFDWRIWAIRRKKEIQIDYCLCCGGEIINSVKVKRKSKFCDRSCAAKFNNVNKSPKQEKFNNCINCGKKLSKSMLKYCSHDCQRDYKYKKDIENWLSGNDNGISGKYGIKSFIRKYLHKKYDSKCQKCGWGEMNPKTNKIPLQIHHINGDCLNNDENNLELLCPNCHSLTETFGNLNKESKRIFRVQKN